MANSELNRKKTYWSITGGILGGFLGSAIGVSLSPNKESDNFNTNLGASLGLLSGVFIGHYLAIKDFESDPQNFIGDPIEIENEELKPKARALNELSKINLQGLNLNITQNRGNKIYKATDIPDAYGNYLKKQVLIEHKIPTKKIELKDGRTLILKDAKVLEHKFTN
jgi:hypothetical protein